MKILLLTQWFDPEPTFKGLLFAKELTARGHQVEVLTGFPNYPGGKIYPGYRVSPWMREQIDGVRILRVALYPSHNTSGLRRALNYFSFAISAAILGSLLIGKPDVIYVYHPPPTVGLAAAAIQLFRGAPFVYDIQDLWPDTAAVSGMLTNSKVLALLARWCSMLYRHAKHITVLSPGFREKLISRGVPSCKVDVIYNWSNEPSLNGGVAAARLEDDTKFSILFAGTMGLAQDLESVLEAARLCSEAVPKARFILMGGGIEKPRLERMASKMQLDNVMFLPRQPMEAMGSILSRADALLVHLKDDPLFRITIPSKTQAYMAVGRPILMAVRGDAAELVEQSGCGVVCEPGNPQSIAAGVKKLVDAGPERLAAMGYAGKEFYDRALSLSAGVDKFERIFEKVIRKKCE